MLKYGDDNSLMTLLGLQAINDFEAAGVVNTQAAAAAEAAGCSWRVAVHPPLNNDAEILEHAKHVAASSGFVDTEVGLKLDYMPKAASCIMLGDLDLQYMPLSSHCEVRIVLIM